MFAASQMRPATMSATRTIATISVGASPGAAAPGGGETPSPPCMISGPKGMTIAPSMAAFEYGILSVNAIPRWKTTTPARSGHLSTEPVGSTKMSAKRGSMNSAAWVTRRSGVRQRGVQNPGARAIGIRSAACMAEPSRHMGLVNLYSAGDQVDECHVGQEDAWGGAGHGGGEPVGGGGIPAVLQDGGQGQRAADGKQDEPQAEDVDQRVVEVRGQDVPAKGGDGGREEEQGGGTGVVAGNHEQARRRTRPGRRPGTLRRASPAGRG